MMSGGSDTPIRLPHGLFRDGSRHRTVRLRPLIGRDEERLRTIETAQPQAIWTTAVLQRCVERIGNLRGPSEDAIAGLTVGDREALLLHVRRGIFGDRFSCVIGCPACAEKLDLDLSVGELLLDAYENASPTHELKDAVNGEPVRIRFRLPTGGDQMAVADRARSRPVEAATEILVRCTEEIRGERGEELPIEDTLRGGRAEPLRSALAEEMERFDPQAELRLELRCPDCEHAFTSVLDTGAYLAEELDQRIRRLYDEVHVLAFYYHWGEAEILDLPSEKRRRYIRFLNAAVAPS